MGLFPTEFCDVASGIAGDIETGKRKNFCGVRGTHDLATAGTNPAAQQRL
jgi:hypothetical protein